MDVDLNVNLNATVDVRCDPARKINALLIHRRTHDFRRKVDVV